MLHCFVDQSVHIALVFRGRRSRVRVGVGGAGFVSGWEEPGSCRGGTGRVCVGVGGAWFVSG